MEGCCGFRKIPEFAVMRRMYLGLLLLSSSIAFSQKIHVAADGPKNLNSMYLKGGIYELSLGYERTLGERVSIGCEVDYRPRFKHSGNRFFYFNTPINISIEALRFKLPINYYFENDNFFLSAVPTIRSFRSDRIIDYPNGFGGGEGEYRVYAERGFE